MHRCNYQYYEYINLSLIFDTVPKRPPRTDIGSFESVTSPIDKTIRDVFIYWQNIEDNEKCGESFEYLVYYTTLAANNSTM